jgi:hypothetical protein
VWYGATCIADLGGSADTDGVAVCVELPLFWFVCWLLLGVVCGFPLYFGLAQRDRNGAMNKNLRVKQAIAIAMMSAATAGCAHVSKTAEYRKLVDDYSRAQPHPAGQVDPRSSITGWYFKLTLPGSPTVASVEGEEKPSVVTISYSDEQAARRLYKYVDYSSPLGIRTAGSILYVYWGETLFSTHWWLMAYDWVNRREVERRRVDPADLPK